MNDTIIRTDSSGLCTLPINRPDYLERVTPFTAKKQILPRRENCHVR